jgi:hypothetical protein
LEKELVIKKKIKVEAEVGERGHFIRRKTICDETITRSIDVPVPDFYDSREPKENSWK